MIIHIFPTTQKSPISRSVLLSCSECGWSMFVSDTIKEEIAFAHAVQKHDTVDVAFNKVMV